LPAKSEADIAVVVLQPLAGWTHINVLSFHIATVLFPEPTFGIDSRGHGLRQCDRDAGLLARQDLLATEVAAVSRGSNVSVCRVAFVSLATRASWAQSEPTFVTSGVTMRKMMLGVDGDLHVVGDNPGVAPARCH